MTYCNYCRDCKYWITEPKDVYDYDYDNREPSTNAGKIGICERSKYLDQFRLIDTIKDLDSMISVSEWGDATQIIVGELFGCVHFKNKEK